MRPCGLPSLVALAFAGTFAVVSLCGCPDTPADPGCELGTGTESFVAVEDGDVLAVERGSQGGVHVRGSLRAWGLDPGSADDVQAFLHNDRPEIEFQLASDEGALSIENVMRRALTHAGPGEFEFLGQIVQFHYWVELPENWTEIDWEQEEERLETLDLELSLRIKDVEGVEVRDARTVRIEFPPREGDDDDAAEEPGEELGTLASP
jgi:hypothetical protein